MRKRICLAGLSLLAWAGTAGAQAWEKVVVPDGNVWADPDWDLGGLGWGPRGVLSVDRSGRIYVSNGPKLHVAQRGGTSWQTLHKPKGSGAFLQKRPLGAGAEGTVIWGEWFSKDGGGTWDSLSRPGGSFATCVYKDGSILLATGGDGIERGAPPWTSWQSVHRGSTFGHIGSFHYTEGPSIFALPLADGLLHSLDSGKTWKEWRANPSGWPELGGSNVRAMDFEEPSGVKVLAVVEKSNNSSSGNLLVRMHSIFPQLDTLKTVLPDSPATALQVTRDGAVWISFRSQGVHVSRDKGRTFAAHNQGLDGLFVEALEMTSDGDLYAFSRNGIYRIRQATAIAPRLTAPRATSRSGYALHLGGLPAALQPKTNSPIRIQADGRLLITPVP